jgi:hypothetical protein
LALSLLDLGRRAGVEAIFSAVALVSSLMLEPGMLA